MIASVFYICFLYLLKCEVSTNAE